MQHQSRLIGRMLIIGLFIIGSANLFASTPPSAEQTRTFTIENMTCPLCPVTVNKAMNNVDGVKSVDVDFDAKTATVRFDPTITTVDEIANASTNAGYPATVSGEG